MSTALKCPGPSCTFVFDPRTVPPGVVLACPRCGTRFTLGNPAAPAAGVPQGYPAAPANPLEAAFGEMTPETARADDQEGPRLPVRGSPLQTLLLVVVGVVALAAAGVAIWYKVTNTGGPPPAGAAELRRDVNLRFEPPPSPWSPDKDTRARLGPPFFEVYRRENPEAFMAFGARDFADREPRPGELDDVLFRALGTVVGRDTLKTFENDFAKTWMGREARGFKFSGLAKEAGSVEGEAVAVSHKGVGYWFVAWTGANEIYAEQKPAFETGRSGCQLLQTREQWSPKIPPLAAYKNTTIGYAFVDSEHVWDEVEGEAEVKGQDPKADKFLVVYRDRKARNKEIDARLVVAVLDGGGDDPLADGQSHVEKQVNELAELQGRYTIKEHTDPPEGDPTNPADGNAPVKLLRATNETNPTYSWLYAVSAVKAGDKTVVLYAWCQWKDRRKFDTKFIQVAKSLRANK